MAESTAKMRQEIMALSGVDIMLNKNTFKSTYQIMDELSKKWEDLSDIAQASIIELMAGKHQGNVFASLMTNFDTAREALEVSANSAGSAMQEHAKWSESLEARLLKLKATWQSLAQSFMGSDFLKSVLNGVIALVNGLDKLIDTFGTLPTLLGLFVGVRSLFSGKGFFTFDKDAKSIQLLGNGLTDLKGKYTQMQTAISRYNSLSSKSVSFQETYNKNLAKSTSSMGKYLQGLNGAKASMGGYVASLVGAKVASFALQAATMALNMALTMGIGAIISFAMQGIDKLITTSKELAEKVEEVTSKFKEQHGELKKLQGDYDTTNENSMISKYEKLSKGVDGLGKNVSLTAEEYSEYQSIVNKIAEQVPSLVSGYDEQGNAILSCKGNVEELTTAYEKLIHAQNQQILSSNSADIEKNWKNTLKQANGYDFWEKTGNSLSATWLFGSNNLKNFDMKTDTAEWLASLNPSTSLEKIKEGLGDWDSYRRAEVIQALQNAGYDVDHYSDIGKTLKKALEKEPQKIKGILDNYYAQFDNAVAEYKTKATALLSEAFDVSSSISGLNYGNISEELQSIAYQTVNSLDFEDLKDGMNIEQWTKEMLNQLNAIGEVENTQIETAFNLQTQFNGGEISYGEYVKNLKDVESTIDGLELKSEAKEQLKISLGLDDEGVIDQYNALVKRLTDSKNYDFDISETEAKKLLDGLSSEELSVAVDVITDMSNNDYYETAEEIKTAIERELSKQGLSLDLKIEVEKTKLEAAATAISESFSGSGLSEESISAIDGMFSSLSSYDQSKLFERTANGIRLNSDEYRKLNSEYKKTNIANVNKEMDSLGDIYNQTREELYRLTYGTDEYNAKATELSGIEQQIKDLEQLAAGYEGLASAYQEWQMVESAGSQRDMYESIIEGFENIDDEISRGWYDDGTIEFLELLSGKDLSTAGIEEVKKAYKGLGKEIKHTSYSVRDFFTVDDEGNSTNTGVYNFLDAIGQLEEEAFGGKDVVKRDKNGTPIAFDFQIVGGDKVIAEALGISEELVQIMVRAADDAGFVVSMDGTYQQLDVLKEKAQEAAESLNSALEKSGKEGFDFNFNASNVDDITKQLGEAKKILDTFRNTDGTINTKLEGADEALTVASTLQSMLDKLTRPTYMNIQTNQVEDELQEPLSQLQQLRRLTETEHQVKLSGGDTTQLQEDIDELYAELDRLPNETKIEIGLYSNVNGEKKPLTGDALKEKINEIVSGETELGITATVDIQMKMDDKLGILVDKALLEAGIIDDEEFKKRVNIYLEADVDNEDAKNKTQQAVDNVVKDTKSDVENAKTDVKSKVEDVKSEVKNAKNNIKSEKDSINSEVENVKSEVKSIKSEIANAKSDVEGLADSLKTLQGISEETNVSVTAQLYGNVPKMDEGKEIDDLLMFSEGAKALQDLPEDISVSVYANLTGNVPNLNEGEQTDDLLMFASGVEALKDLPEETNVTVKAQLDGNVPDLNESKQTDDLLMFAEGVKALKDLPEKTNIDVTANLHGNVPNMNEGEQTDDLLTFAEGTKALKDLGLKADEKINIDVTANLHGNVPNLNEGEQIDDLLTFAEGTKALKDLGLGKDEQISVKVNAQLDGNVPNLNEGEQIDDLLTFAKGAKELKDLGLDKDEFISVSVTANLDGNVPNMNEGEQINDIITFAEGAADLKALGLKDDEVISVSVTAQLDGNVPNLNEGEQIDDLLTFAKGTKALKDLGLKDDEKIRVSVTANLDGNVPNMNEGEQINDIITFAEGAADLKALGLGKDEQISVKVNAQLDGNVPNLNEGEQIDDLLTFAEGAKSLKGIENVDLTVTAQLNGNVPNLNEGEQIDDLLTFAEGAKALQGIESKTVTVKAQLDGNVPNLNEGEQIDDLLTFAKGAKELQGIENKSVTISANANGNVITSDGASSRLSSLAEFKSLVHGMSNQTVTVSVTANVDSENVNKAIQLLRDVQNSGVFKDYKATVQVGAKIATIDDAVVKNYQAPKKDGKVAYSVDPTSSVFTWVAPNKDGVVNYDAEVEALTNAQKHKTGTITYTPKIKGFPVVNGTANANGSTFANGANGKAYRQGDWGVKQTTTALTGELGQELVVYGNRYWTVGDNGAEFATIPKGAIVFNHKQTEELFANGRVTSGGGRGRVFANGTTFAEGTAFSSGSGGGTEIVVGKNSNTGKSYKKSSSDSKDGFEETFDLIEIATSRVERAIDNLDQKANNVYKSWSSRNVALSNQISEVGNEINLQQKAYNEYMKAASGVGLSSSWANKIKNGQVDITTIKDESLAEKISDYQDYYERALDCKDAIEELKETEAELYAQRVENIATQYEGILGVIEHEKNMIEEYISQNEANAQLISGEYYKALINNENETLSQLQKQKNTMLSELQTAMNSGTITKGSEAWYKLVNSIDEVTLSIQESKTQLKEYEQIIQQLSFETFDILQDKISSITDETDFLIELMSSDKLRDDSGKLTDEGSATMGLHGQNYNVYMYQADLVAKETERLKKQLASDPYDTELEERYREMISLQQEYILAAQDEKEAIRDMVEEGIELEIEALEERIDKYNESLESQKDLYDYQKKVKEQTEEIASLEKQMSAYSGDDSEEAKAKIQELKVSLEEAKSDLEETEYDKYISDAQQMLDDLTLQYSEILNTRLDNIDALISDVIAQINMDSTSISTTLSEKADSVGYTLSNSMTSIWDTNSTKINSVITTYGEKFTLAQTTTNNALSTINSNLQKMITQLNSMAKTNVKSASTSSAANNKKADTSKPTTTTTSKPTTTNTTKSIKVGGMVNARGAQIYDYAGDTSGERQLYRNDPKYKVLKTNGNWIQVRWHKLSSGITGWFKKSDVKAYKTGVKNLLDNEVAWTQEGNKREFIVRPSDGAILTPLAKGDSVLNANASGNIWNMANNPSDFIKDNLNLGGTNIPNNSNVQNNYTQHIGQVVFDMENVHNYNEMLSMMQKDKNFEKLLLSMTIDRVAGKSSLAKGKVIK